MSGTKIFRNSRWDVLCVAVIPFQATFFVLLAFQYQTLSALTLLLLVPVVYALAMQNSGANHNHYHTPIFSVRWLNTITRMGFSFWGAPKTPHNIYHGIHHATHKSWNELSFLKITGLSRPPHRQVLGLLLFALESFGLKYFLLIYLVRRWPLERVAALTNPEDPELALRILKKVTEPSAMRATKLDLVAWVGIRVGLCLIDWKFFFFYFVPVTYVVESLRMGEDYLHHWGASDFRDSRRDAVSCYGKLYNWLTFNLGYHQEHHLRPGAHWMKLSAMTASLPSDRRIVPFTHYLNLPVFYPAFAEGLTGKSGLQTTRASMDGGAALPSRVQEPAEQPLNERGE